MISKISKKKKKTPKRKKFYRPLGGASPASRILNNVRFETRRGDPAVERHQRLNDSQHRDSRPKQKKFGTY